MVLETSAQSQVFQQSSTSPSNQSELTRVFNAALLSTQSDRKRDFANELYQLVETPAFECILGSIRSLARTTGVSERQAAEQIILTFRRLDSVWSEYVMQEGLDRLRNPT
jgi:hypothetical protein